MTQTSSQLHAPRSAAAFRDSRADDGERSVTLSARAVTIARRLRGVRMTIRVPMQAYRGIVLSLQPAADSRLLYVISLRHHDPDLDVTLEETFDEAEAVRLWRRWGRTLDAPLCVARLDGGLQREGGAERNAAQRRRSENVATRRSRGRFARRRRVGRPRADAVVHRGEREIICYE